MIDEELQLQDNLEYYFVLHQIANLVIKIEELIQDYSKLLQDAIQIKKDADAIEEHKTSTFMDDIIGSYSKNIWMLKQSME